MHGGCCFHCCYGCLCALLESHLALSFVRHNPYAHSMTISVIIIIIITIDFNKTTLQRLNFFCFKVGTFIFMVSLEVKTKLAVNEMQNTQSCMLLAKI